MYSVHKKLGNFWVFDGLQTIAMCSQPHYANQIVDALQSKELGTTPNQEGQVEVHDALRACPSEQGERVPRVRQFKHTLSDAIAAPEEPATKKLPCQHVAFESDGGRCCGCGKTWLEING